jgi:murein L,D-transpeptidase YcbB/YkuD
VALKHSLQSLALTLWSILALCGFSAAAGAVDGSEEVRHRFEAMTAGFQVTAGQQPLLAGEALREFYEKRNFELAWFQDNRLRPEALDLLRTIDRSAGEGLQPGDYHQEAIARRIEGLSLTSTVAAQIDLDLLLSDAFLLLGSHLLAGKVNPETLAPEWAADRHGVEMAPLLAQALETGSVEAMLDTLRPSQPGYQRLREERKRMSDLMAEGNWENIPTGPLIHPGNVDPRIPLIRTRLIALGDYARPELSGVPVKTAALADKHAYNIELLAAVSRFQARHDLEPDGIIGPGTIAELNTSPANRLRKIEINMERWRWMPEQLGSLHVLVNLAGAYLQVISENRPILKKTIVSGSTCRSTPVFSDEIGYLVFNPSWTVPPTLAAQAGLPEIHDPSSLKRLGFKLYRGWGDDRAELEPGSVGTEAAPYRLVQTPGPLNALGRIKVMFPNRFNFYLHGKASEGSFSKSEAPFSYDCVRVENPLALADVLLGQESGWSHKRFKNSAETVTESQALYLKEPIPIHVQYLTAWAGQDGILQLRRDVHGRDRPVAEALAKTPG